MRDRAPLFALLASALTFLASLYLPWQEVSYPGLRSAGGQGVLGLLNLFAFGNNSDGLTTQAGVVASLAALVLIAAAAVALVRPGGVGHRLPLFPFALALLYLAIAGLAALRGEEAPTNSFQHSGTQYHYAYGAYLGVAAAAVTLLAAAFLERASLARRPTSVEVIALLLGAGLLVAFLLPWASALFLAKAISYPGVNDPLVVLAAVGVCLLVGALLRSRSAPYVGGMIAVLVGASMNEVSTELRVDYGAWTALGLALALVAAAAFVRQPARPATPSLSGALGAAAAAVYVIGLFLPWREFCATSGHTLGAGLGRCYVMTGWAAGESSAAAGTLALVAILAAVVLTWSAVATAELTLAIAILTAVVGVTIDTYRSGTLGWTTGSGAYVGFAAAGALLLVGLVRLRPPQLEGRRVIGRLIPVAASISCLCAIALPAWSALPERWSPHVKVLGGWYAIAAVLLTLHLVRRWLEFAGGPSDRAEELVLLPLGVLALTALALIHEHGNGMTWGGGILVGLCIVLTLFGWIEQRGDLEGLRVPEILRVDRLPGAET
jgi:hypothetical protein